MDQAVLQGLADSFFARHSRPQATIGTFIQCLSGSMLCKKNGMKALYNNGYSKITNSDDLCHLLCCLARANCKDSVCLINPLNSAAGVKRKEPDLSVFMTPFGDLPEDPKDWVYPLLIWPVPNQPHSKPPQPLESFRAYAARVGADMDCLGRQRDGWLNYWKDLVPPFVFRGLEEGLTSQVDILKRLARGDDAGLHVLRLSNYAMTLHPTSVAEFSHDVHFSSGGHDPEHWFVQLENPTRRAPVWGLFYDWVKTGGMKAWLPDAADVSSAKRELQGREAAKVPANRQIYPPYSIKPHLVELPSRRSGSLLVSCLRKIAGRAEVVYSVNHACSFCKRRGHEIWSIFITPRGSLACIDCLLKNAPKGRTTLLWEQIYGSQGYRRELPVSRGLEGEGGSVSERAPAQGPLTKEGGEQESTVSHPKARVGAVRVHPMTTREHSRTPLVLFE